MSRAPAAALAGAVLLLPLLLAACGDEPQVDRPIVRHPDVRAELSYARGEGPVLLVVEGQAFRDTPEASLRRATLDAVQGGPPGTDVIFTLNPAEAGQTQRRLVIAFNPPTTARGDELCAGGEVPGEPPGADGVVELAAAFCSGGRALTQLTGRAPDLRDPDQSDFREWVRVAMRELFPEADR